MRNFTFFKSCAMKSMNFFRSLAVMLIAFGPGLSAWAQDHMLPHIDGINAAEKAVYLKMLMHQPSGLVNNYDLKYHRFQWLVDPSQLAIRGSVTSYYVVTSALSEVQFELAPELSADSAFHHGFRVNLDHSGNLLTINLGEIIPQGTLDSLTVYYHGNPPNTGFGSFGIGTHSGVPALWTLSEPFGASDWWPSKNDLTDKIDSLDIFVATYNGYTVASNGVMMGVSPYGPNLSVTHWKHSYPIASYLIAIAVTKYLHYTEYFTGQGGTYPIENYVYQEDSLRCRQQTAGLMPVYALYDSLFGSYPFEREKYGHAEFGWGGGMEHQTMTFIGQNAFNINILSHELSHQWFGDMVTCGSWHDIWLNEGFATYCAGLMFEHLSPDHDWLVWKNQNITYVTMYPDGTVYCEDTTSVNRIFDSRLSYSKGALVLHQLRWIVGDSAFFAGLRNYLEDPDLRYGFAFTPDFVVHMETSSGRDLAYYFDDWIYKQGFPSYHATISQDGLFNTTLTMNQTQSDPSVSFFRLPVPMQFFGGGSDTLLVFDNTFTGQVFEFNPGFKIDSVHFDPEMWLISANNEVALGDNEMQTNNLISLQPVPANSVLRVSFKEGTDPAAGVVDLAGVRVNAPVISRLTDRLLLDVSRLAPGIYILHLNTGNKSVSRKFAVMH